MGKTVFSEKYSKKERLCFVCVVGVERLMGAVRLCAVVRRCEFRTESCSTFWVEGSNGGGPMVVLFSLLIIFNMCIMILTIM